jgi:hypothetical protein
MLKRNLQLITRFTREEYDKIIEKQKHSSLPGEVFRRKILLGAVLKEAPPIEYFDLTRQLRILGNNINQIARVANASGLTEGEVLRREVENLIELEKIVHCAFAPEKEE